MTRRTCLWTETTWRMIRFDKTMGLVRCIKCWHSLYKARHCGACQCLFETQTQRFGCTDLANDAKCYVVGFGASLEGQTSFDKAVTECGQSKHVSDDVL